MMMLLPMVMLVLVLLE